MKILCAAGVAGRIAATTSPVHAQSSSSVTLYGVLDAGITYVTNQKGGHSYSMDNGIASPNLWGMRSTEDLGGRNHAVFELIDQFNLGTGAMRTSVCRTIATARSHSASSTTS